MKIEALVVGATGIAGRGEVGRDLHLRRGVSDGQADVDRIPGLQAGGLADGGADADHVLAAHDADGAAVLVAVDVDQHGRALAGRQLLDDLAGDHDAGVVALRGDGGVEDHARGGTRGGRRHLGSPLGFAVSASATKTCREPRNHRPARSSLSRIASSSFSSVAARIWRYGARHS